MTGGARDRLLRLAGSLAKSDPTDDEIASVAMALAASGARLPYQGASSATFASTGGPSSLTTLLVPLVLRAYGFRVPSLGVPGRPAGGVDVLATIPGYKIELSKHEVESALAAAGHAHFVAGPTWAPDDARLFQLRQRANLQAHPPLVIASLLAKTVAVGVRRVCVEVRVADHGNFGQEIDAAKKNSERLIRVGGTLGLTVVCVLTDGRVPYQPAIGRGEALGALVDVLMERNRGAWLDAHTELCRFLARALARAGADPSVQSVREAFSANLEAQGTTFAQAAARAAAVRSQQHAHWVASRDGYVEFRLDAIRRTVVNYQVGTAEPDGAGLTLLCPPGRRVAMGQTVMSYRCSAGGAIRQRFEAELANCVVVRATPAGARFEPVLLA